MPFFMNPFKKQDVSDFEGVFVPLAQAQRHRSVVSAYDDKKDDQIGVTEEKKLESPADPANGYSSLTIEGLRAEIELDLAASGHDTAYDRKSTVINKAIQDIGMGRYQWSLFALCGFGWLADNMWLQGVALTLPGLTAEFGPSSTQVRYTTCALFIGLCIGASFWGIASDVIGRRLAFNMTLFLAGVFGLAVGGGNSWVGTAGLFAALGVGVGGNGWRYLNITLGAITFVMFMCRFFLFHLYESPKFLLSQGRQAEAVATVHGIAYKNRKTTWLSEEILNEIGGTAVVEEKEKLSTSEIIKRNLNKFSTQRIAPLFATRQLALMIGVPGSLIAYYTVNIKYIGRKGTIAVSTVVTGILVFCFTISTDPSFQLTFSSLEAFFQNIMYGVLYAYTPEVFPAPNRGTGTGIASCLNRIAGLCAPIVAVNAGQTNPKAPIYASGGLFLAAFVAMLFFPIETRNKQSL
ncbi:MAG: hypothetical protein L6R37_003990 [Teloschistes peruensis]|nr:MAG: hypothetical protein L6R37_003990 [Teloschistes peruensis]